MAEIDTYIGEIDSCTSEIHTYIGTKHIYIGEIHFYISAKRICIEEIHSCSSGVPATMEAESIGALGFRERNGAAGKSFGTFALPSQKFLHTFAASHGVLSRKSVIAEITPASFPKDDT